MKKEHCRYVTIKIMLEINDGEKLTDCDKLYTD